MVKEIKADTTEISGVLYQAATGDSGPTLFAVAFCDRAVLERVPNRPDGLYYHWSATESKGSAIYRLHGQDIEISWWYDGGGLKEVRVRVKNPTLETFLAVPEKSRVQLKQLSSSGRWTVPS